MHCLRSGGQTTMAAFYCRSTLSPGSAKYPLGGSIMTSVPRRRRDERGRAFAGSQLQIQTYVNRRRNQLDAAILSTMSAQAGRIDWRSPLEGDNFAEFMDGRF